jgi:hypothetical protein
MRAFLDRHRSELRTLRFGCPSRRKILSDFPLLPARFRSGKEWTQQSMTIAIQNLELATATLLVATVRAKSAGFRPINSK